VRKKRGLMLEKEILKGRAMMRVFSDVLEGLGILRLFRV
jgi:hypothetical protein